MNKQIDIQKIFPTISNGFDAIDKLIVKEQELLEAINILQSVIEYPGDMDIIKPRIERFLSQFLIESI